MKDTNEVLVALRRIIRATALHSKQLNKVSGLTAPQLLIMQTIRRVGEMTIGVLAREVSLSQATVTTILDRLEKRGLIHRQRGETDKRKVYVQLTASGEKLIQNSPALLQTSFIRQFEGLQDWEQNLIISALQRVAEMMNATDIAASSYLEVDELGDLPLLETPRLPTKQQTIR
ncbi:MarR family winged helix-turn-helix transcriptional regulator [Nitrosococcus watsonii]|uniref:Transcriptional regulator, MarR family n=1 Tax=Nitrosococcus watsoni (strain C-113) TaxID=105559 RepID=D8K7G1_NITWC|nr:MarR family transcriptional regulator [Nitrosococcus watsonii]ADJ28838.1 transcriptional regulator, MarR family [Nitrosococcus watsonii C-113]